MTLHVFDRTVVEEEGEGDAVVCVHGLGGSTNTFTPLMPALARHRVIRVDMPGSARSQRVEGPLIDRALRRDAALGLHPAERDARALDRPFARHHRLPARRGDGAEARAQPRPVRPADRAAGSGTDGDPRARREGARRGRGRHARDRARPRQRGDLGRHAPALAARGRLRAREPDAPGRRRLRAQLRGARRGAARPRSSASRRRCCSSPATRTASRRRSRCARSPRSCTRAKSTRVVVLPRCGHWTPIERPEECARELRDFLAAQR